MMKSTFLLPAFFLFTFSLFSQSNIQQATSINTDGASPAASAILDVQATDKGMLVPRMTAAQRTAIAAPAAGLLVYEIPTPPITVGGGFWFYNGTTWQNLSIQKVLADADGDTKIQVEESPDEDIIRFDLGGTEEMVLRKNANGAARLELPDAGNSTIIGHEAGMNNVPVSGTSGANNTFLGYRSGNGNTTGSGNSATGASSLYSNTSGSYNTAGGLNALYANDTGNENTANGSFALTSNTTGQYNTAHGSNALLNNTSGSSNVALGKDALYSNTTSSELVAIGDSALFNNGIGAVPTQDASNLIAIGSKALYSNTTGFNNIAVGRRALYANTTGFLNIAIGNFALHSNIGSFNLAIGDAALLSNTTGNFNTAFGRSSLYLSTTGNGNTCIGVYALYSNFNGHYNTANGFEALENNTTGNWNTAIGQLAMKVNTIGFGNTALGSGAEVAANNLSNATALGNTATTNISNKVRIGNTAVTVIEGQVDWTYPSDARFKFNIHDDLVPGLAFIEKLRPVTYQFDTRKFDEHLMQNMPDSVQQRRLAGQDYSESSARLQTGFLAQEVEQVCKDLNFQFSGLHVPESEVDNYGLAYGSFVPLLVKAVQEQQAIIETQQADINNLKKLESENATLKAELHDNKSQLDKITAALTGAGINVEK